MLEVDIKRGAEHAGELRNLPGVARGGVARRRLGSGGRPELSKQKRPSTLPWKPRPVRSWDGGEYGPHDLSEELQLVREDDVLLWRMIYLAIVADLMLKAQGTNRRLAFGPEQPAAMDYMPETVSLWQTREWISL